ncbi:unnamed protein product [Urochloa humidicola]
MGEPALAGNELAADACDGAPVPPSSVRMGPVSPFSGASADFAASGGVKSSSVTLKVVFERILQSLIPSHPLPSFHHISRITVNLDSMVPSYIADTDVLWHLAKVVEDETTVIEQLSDVEILDKMLARKGSKKRRARKARGPLDFGGLRRSTRLKKPHGFKTDVAARAAFPADEVPAAENEPAANETLEPHPLEVVPPGSTEGALVLFVGVAADPEAPPAPHLSASLATSIGTQFLKMQPSAVSKDVLMAESSDEE